eukprot:TRINITY_DN21353_c0_g1_i1.p2 TRINITY_DN21353_c0_g1~~TRINITY_DN21353_c0_g1_i1.p2  ORF type:complete len:344 (+),score=113.22 TRINITY_DN21353_c0_g1_i1:34-1065(+)
MAYQGAFGEGISAEAVEGEYFEGYGDISVHRLMVRDEPRMEAYKEAVKGVVGKVVIDVGAGSGVLSLMAARAGAKHVYAVEASDMAGVLQQIVTANNFCSKITVLKKRVESVTKADINNGEGADAIMSEWMGFYLLHESMLPSVLWARDNLLKPGPVQKEQMLPCTADIKIAPLNMTQHVQDHVHMWGNVDGFDLSALKEAAFTQLVSQPLIDIVPSDSLSSEAQTVVSFDLCTATPLDLVSISSTHDFKTVAPSTCVSLWFDVGFYNPITNTTNKLCTAPASQPTHWKQTTIFLPADPIGAGSLQVAASIVQSDDNARCYELSIELLDYEETAAQKLLAALQ